MVEMLRFRIFPRQIIQQIGAVFVRYTIILHTTKRKKCGCKPHPDLRLVKRKEIVCFLESVK